MNELIDYYEGLSSLNLSANPSLAKEQKTALKQLKAIQFPNLKNEDWKYTSVDSFLAHRFKNPSFRAEKTVSNPLLKLIECYQIIIQDGHLSIDEENHHLPQGVIIETLEQALSIHDEILKPYWGKLQYQQGFQALNTANLNTGLFIYIPKQLNLTLPLFIQHWQGETEQAVHSRVLILLEEGASATIIEDYAGDKETTYLTNTVQQVFLNPDASLTHYKIQKENAGAFHISYTDVQQAHQSQYESHVANLGGQLVRSELNINLHGEHAKCLLNGIYLPAQNQHIDNHTTICHSVPHCQSQQDYKGVLAGKSRAVFNGKVIVKHLAQQSIAHQKNKNILLSSQAEIDTKPQLEIFADDVICSHGATVGQLDEEALFYLATRGISRSEAIDFLIQAFIKENLALIKDKSLSQYLELLIGQKMESCYE